jgi:hypothetical protein
MVGRAGLEPATSRLSGVRSNHLSYRPPPRTVAGHNGRRRREPASGTTPNGLHKQRQVAVFQDEGT